MGIRSGQRSIDRSSSQAWSLIPGSIVSRLAVMVDDRAWGPSVRGSAQVVDPARETVGSQFSGSPGGSGRLGDAGLDAGEQPVSDALIEELSAAECLVLLSEHHFGRLAFIDTKGMLPLIIPVNYLFDEGTAVFRTDPGSKLTAAILGAPVAFEVDGLDRRSRTGWSVVVHGRAQRVSDPAEQARLRLTPLVSWAPGAKPHYVRVHTRQVTGRRVRRADLPSNWWG